jgi:ABC-type spermidine/putrescine transport system permease subunit I
LAPIILWQIIFFVCPMALLAVYSFWRLIDYKIDYTPTLYNYRDLFSNPLLFNALLLSLEVAVAVTIVCAVLAYPIAYFIAKKAGRWRVLLLILVIVPFWTSFILRAYAWKLLLGERGFINSGLRLLGIIDHPIQYLLYSPVATSIGLIYAFLPFYILPLYTSIDKVQDSWLAAAQDLGATPARTFFEVTFPLCIPGLVVGAVFTFIFAVGDYVIPQLLGGGRSCSNSKHRRTGLAEPPNPWSCWSSSSSFSSRRCGGFAWRTWCSHGRSRLHNLSRARKRTRSNPQHSVCRAGLWLLLCSDHRHRALRL